MTIYVLMIIVSLSTFEGNSQRFNGGINQCMIAALEFNNEQTDALAFCQLEKEIQKSSPQSEGSHSDNEMDMEKSPNYPSRQNPRQFQGKDNYAY